MPVASDPNARRAYTLRSDRGAGMPHPRFFFRYLTRRQKTAYTQLGRESESESNQRTPEETISLLYARLGEVLIGWENLSAAPPVDKPENVAIPFTPADLTVLDGALNDRELWELYWAGALDFDEDDKRFLSLQPSTSSDASANPAPPAAP